MRPVKAAHAEVLPGYRLLEFLGKGGVGEVWKCEAPGGFLKAIKFVAGDLDGVARSGEAAQKEFKALQLLKAIRHPFLLNVERVEVVDGELLIVTELADRNLRDVLSACQKAGIPSIPRTDLLRYLEEAAEVLDLMTQEHQLLHLDVKPDNIFLVANHAKVGDFGLLTGMVDADGGEASAGGLSPAYAAPEVFCGQVSPQSDQYSLAVVYCELRTGVLPFQGKNLRRMMLLHTTQAPDLSLLPAEEREVVARALAKEPRDRFKCSKDFLQALRGHPPARPPEAAPRAPHSRSNLRAPAIVAVTTGTRGLLEERIARAAPAPHAALGGESDGLFRRLVSPLPPPTLRQEFQGFLRFWNGRPAPGPADCLLGDIRLPESCRLRYPGCRLGLDLALHLSARQASAAPQTEIAVRLRPRGPGVDEQRMLEEIGPLVVQSLKNHLQAQDDQRRFNRIEWRRPITVRPVWIQSRALGEPIDCQGADLSALAVRFVSPIEPPTPLLQIDLGQDDALEPLVLLSRILRVQPGSGGYDVVARFCWNSTPRPDVPVSVLANDAAAVG